MKERTQKENSLHSSWGDAAATPAENGKVALSSLLISARSLMPRSQSASWKIAGKILLRSFPFWLVRQFHTAEHILPWPSSLRPESAFLPPSTFPAKAYYGRAVHRGHCRNTQDIKDLLLPKRPPQSQTPWTDGRGRTHGRKCSREGRRS